MPACLPSWLTNYLTDWLTGWLTNWLTNWVNDWFVPRCRRWAVGGTRWLRELREDPWQASAFRTSMMTRSETGKSTCAPSPDVIRGLHATGGPWAASLVSRLSLSVSLCFSPSLSLSLLPPPPSLANWGSLDQHIYLRTAATTTKADGKRDSAYFCEL